MSSRQRWLWLVVVATIVTAGGAVVVFGAEIGCRLPMTKCPEIVNELLVRNDRVHEITIRVDSSAIAVPPGQTRSLGGVGCDGSVLVATDPAGAEVSRVDPDVACVTGTWFFQADGMVQLVSGRISPTP